MWHVDKLKLPDIHVVSMYRSKVMMCYVEHVSIHYNMVSHCLNVFIWLKDMAPPIFLL